MRPVDKGDAPTVYAHYRDAGVDLMCHIGDYCSYCERQIETHLAVEHIQPKVGSFCTSDLLGQLPALLVSTAIRVKGTRMWFLTIADYWPDQDNTLRAFKYINSGLVQPHPELGRHNDQVRSRNPLSPCELALTSFPENTDPNREPTDSDRRWLARFNA